MAGLKIATRCFAICARRSRRINSSVLPLNMLPQMTSSEPIGTLEGITGFHVSNGVQVEELKASKEFQTSIHKFSEAFPAKSAPQFFAIPPRATAIRILRVVHD